MLLEIIGLLAVKNILKSVEKCADEFDMLENELEELSYCIENQQLTES